MDADMELSYSVVEECVEASIKGFDAVIIPEYSSGNSFWAKCKALEKSCYINDDVMEAARFFRRIVFDSVGGYVPSLEACEDWDLSNRIRHLGFRITRIAALIKHNEGELSLSRSFLKKHYYGKALKSYYRLHPGQEPHSLNVFRLTFIRNLEKLASNPLCATGMLFMKFLELVALLIGRWSA
jgi:GT2 family glycosyltransferase